MSNYPPIQTSTSATISTPESLRGEIDKLNKTIDSLSSVLDTERVLIRSMEQNVDSFIEALMRLTESGDIEDYVAEELADIFGRTLTRTVDVRMTIVLDAQVSVPVGYDLDDLHGDVDVEINPIYAADVQIEGIEVDSIEVEV
jgi:predicted nucleotidyltransferase